MPRPTYAEVNLDAIRSNCRALQSLLGPTIKLMGIVKADAYGHGAVPVAKTLQDESVAMLAVAMVEEGAELRQAGLRVPILVMGPLPADEIPAAIEYELTPTVDDAETARELDRAAAARGRRLAVHLKIDTGMNRLGVRADQVAETATAIARMDHLVLEGAYTHFACAGDEDGETTDRQIQQFEQALAVLRAAHVPPSVIHSANSAAILRLGAACGGMVRPGLALYGIRPAFASQSGPAATPLKPALALRSRVVHLKRVRRGEGASYDHTWRAQRDSWIGILPVGYADGYPRALSNRAQVRVAGRLCPVVGTVCMDATLVDLTDLEGPRTGLEATLIEADNESPLSAAALADLCGTIPYEILTGIGKRVPRVYV
jgi:alanine racemase